MLKKEMLTFADINDVFKSLDLDTNEKRSKFANMGSFSSSNSSVQGGHAKTPNFSLSHKTGKPMNQVGDQV